MNGASGIMGGTPLLQRRNSIPTNSTICFHFILLAPSITRREEKLVDSIKEKKLMWSEMNKNEVWLTGFKTYNQSPRN